MIVICPKQEEEQVTSVQSFLWFKLYREGENKREEKGSKHRFEQNQRHTNGCFGET